MAPDLLPAAVQPIEARKDPIRSLCGQVPHLSTGDRAALRRSILTRSETAVGVVVGLLLRAGVQDAEWLKPATFARWQLLAHVAAVLSGTAADPPHRPGASLGRALHAARYSDQRLMRLTSARGPALVDQIVRVARILAASGQGPVDLWTLHQLSSANQTTADTARLQIARDYYAAEYASTKEAP